MLKEAIIKSVETLQVAWSPDDTPGRRTAFVRVTTVEGIVGYGEASPMQGGLHSLGIIDRDLGPKLIGADVQNQSVVLDRLLHKNIKLGPEGALTGAIAALDLALWDIRGKLANAPVYRLLGGAWRTEIPFYSSVGGNAYRTVDETLKAVETRWKAETPAAIKIRRDGNRSQLDYDVPGDIAKIKAIRKMVGDEVPLAWDANNGYSVGSAMRVGRVLEDLGYVWFEEPIQHYDVRNMGEVAQRLDITVSAGEQSYTLQALADLINAGVRMVQPDIIKMGGITGLMQCAALCFAHGVELVPHQTQPSLAHAANLHVLSTIMHLTKPAELSDGTDRMHVGFRNPLVPSNGKFNVPEGPGLGLEVIADEIEKRRT